MCVIYYVLKILIGARSLLHRLLEFTKISLTSSTWKFLVSKKQSETFTWDQISRNPKKKFYFDVWFDSPESLISWVASLKIDVTRVSYKLFRIPQNRMCDWRRERHTYLCILWQSLSVQSFSLAELGHGVQL